MFRTIVIVHVLIVQASALYTLAIGDSPHFRRFTTSTRGVHSLAPEIALNNNSTLLVPGTHSIGLNASQLLGTEPWPFPLPFAFNEASATILQHAELPLHFLGTASLRYTIQKPGRWCRWRGQELIQAQAFTTLTHHWSRNVPLARVDQFNRDFDPILSMGFTISSHVKENPQAEQYWLLTKYALEWLAQYYLGVRICRTTSIHITAVQSSGASVDLGTLVVNIHAPPPVNPTRHWLTDRFPMRQRMEGEPGEESHLEFLDEYASHGYNIPEVWGDIDPVRRTWAIEMFSGLIQEALPKIEPDQHGHYHFNNFKFHARYIGYNGYIQVTRGQEDKWTRDRAIHAFTTLHTLTTTSGILQGVVKVIIDGQSIGVIILRTDYHRRI